MYNYKRYNKLYNNDTYQHVRRKFEEALGEGEEGHAYDAEITGIMNALTDVALELASGAEPKAKIITLKQLITQSELFMYRNQIDAICEHLDNFTRKDNPIINQLEDDLLAWLNIHEAIEDLTNIFSTKTRVSSLYHAAEELLVEMKRILVLTRANKENLLEISRHIATEANDPAIAIAMSKEAQGNE